MDTAQLRPDLQDEGAQAARATLTRWQESPTAWGIFRRNAAHHRHQGRDPLFCFPVADESYFRVFEAAKARLCGDA